MVCSARQLPQVLYHPSPLRAPPISISTLNIGYIGVRDTAPPTTRLIMTSPTIVSLYPLSLSHTSHIAYEHTHILSHTPTHRLGPREAHYSPYNTPLMSESIMATNHFLQVTTPPVHVRAHTHTHTHIHTRTRDTFITPRIISMAMTPVIL